MGGADHRGPPCAARLRLASVPVAWTLEYVDFDAKSRPDREAVDRVVAQRFLEEAVNVLLVGLPGVGNGHLATWPGQPVVTANY